VKEMAKKKDWKEYGYMIFGLIVGILFAMHGLQKLFGWFGGEKQALMSLMGAAGVIELAVGLCIIAGMYVSYAAILGAITMLVGYFMFHAPQGWNPLTNKGELALLYFAAFMVLINHDKMCPKKK